MAVKAKVIWKHGEESYQVFRSNNNSELEEIGYKLFMCARKHEYEFLYRDTPELTYLYSARNFGEAVFKDLNCEVKYLYFIDSSLHLVSYYKFGRPDSPFVLRVITKEILKEKKEDLDFMSYDFHVVLPIEGVEKENKMKYVEAPEYFEEEYHNPSFNITYNVRDILVATTERDDWLKNGYIGLLKDLMPDINKALAKLIQNEDEYKKYDSPNGWGTTQGVIKLFTSMRDYWNVLTPEYKDVACLRTS